MAGEVTHAGGIVFRREGAAITYLLVTAKNSGEWVLPKGHVEKGEQPEQAALRESARGAGNGESQERVAADRACAGARDA